MTFASAVVVASCASAGTVRPPFRPLHQAVVDTVQADPGDLIAELEQRSIEQGFRIRVSSIMDGYVETRWLNLVTGKSDDGDPAHPERVILLRFWVDPVGPLGLQLTAEAVHRRTSDPSVESRQTEVMVPRDHEGEAILMRVLVGIRERFGG